MKTFICVSYLTAGLALQAAAGEEIVFSADAKLMAMGWEDGRIEIRDSATGKVQTSFLHEGAPKPGRPASAVVWTPGLAFSPDGRTLASSSGYAPVTLWDVDRGEKRRTLPGRSVGYDLTFSGDGSRLIGIGIDSKTGPLRLTLWDTKAGKEIRSMTVEKKLGKEWNGNRFEKVQFSESGLMLVIETYEGKKRFIRIWNAQTAEETTKIEADAEYYSPWFLSPDGKVLVTRDYSRTSGHPEEHAMYDTATGKIIKTWNAADR